MHSGFCCVAVVVVVVGVVLEWAGVCGGDGVSVCVVSILKWILWVIVVRGKHSQDAPTATFHQD